ncbi:MAG: DUF6790 family protein [Chloroflexota bacterium]
MNDLYIVRIFAYSVFPLLLAGAHILLDRNTHTTAQRIEIVVMYLLAISVGANGLGGAFGHLFLSDLVAEGIGWGTGSPFQLEMGFANLALGVLGIMAIGRGQDFRVATIIATTVIGGGATIVHLMDIIAHGNLAPGNTIQNIGNLLDPILLIILTVWSARLTIDNVPAFENWQFQQAPIVGMAAAGIGMGFGIGYALNALLLVTLLGGLIGAGIGIIVRQGHQQHIDTLSTEHSQVG